MGKFTIADLIAVVFLTITFGAMFPAIQEAMAAAWADANLLSKAAISTVIPGIIFSIIGRTLIATEDPVRQPPQRIKRRPRR